MTRFPSGCAFNQGSSLQPRYSVSNFMSILQILPLAKGFLSISAPRAFTLARLLAQWIVPLIFTTKLPSVWKYTSTYAQNRKIKIGLIGCRTSCMEVHFLHSGQTWMEGSHYFFLRMDRITYVREHTPGRWESATEVHCCLHWCDGRRRTCDLERHTWGWGGKQGRWLLHSQ